jgi:hypothetical protein
MQQIGYSVFGMQVRYRSADFLPHNSSSATSSSGAQANPTSNTQAYSQNTVQTSSSIADTNNGNGTLSNGAKIGIGIGVPLIVILLGIIVAFVLIRRQRQRTSQQAPTNEDTPKDTSGYDEHKAELPGNAPGTSGGQRYIGKAELEVPVNPYELEDTNNDWPLPSHSGIYVANTDVDTISSVHGTTHSDMASGAVSPPETSRSCVPPGESVADVGMAEEQVKYRYISEEPKVKKQSSRGEF